MPAIPAKTFEKTSSTMTADPTAWPNTQTEQLQKSWRKKPARPPEGARGLRTSSCRSCPSPETLGVLEWALARPPGRKLRLLLLGRRERRLLRPRSLVANQPHLVEQFGHLHAGERFEKRWHLRGNSGDVAGQLVGSSRAVIAGGNDGDFVHFAERFAERPHDVWQAGDEFVDHGRLVVLLVGFRLDVHGLGFRFTLLEDDFGFGFALRADGRGAALRFAHQALAFGVGQSFDALALDFRLLQHGGDEFAFAARDFRFLHFHLSFAFHLLDLHGFG